MRLGIDVDGVLADFCTSFNELLVDITHKRLISTEAVKNPPVWWWPQHFGYTQEDVDQAWSLVYDSEDFWAHLNPLPGAHDVAERLNDLEHDVYFLTNRTGKKAKFQTEGWLYGLGIDVPTVLLVADKVPVIGALKLDFFIDDKPDTLDHVATERASRYLDLDLYTINYDYNKQVREHWGEAIRGVATVGEALEEVL